MPKECMIEDIQLRSGLFEALIRIKLLRFFGSFILNSPLSQGDQSHAQKSRK